MCVCVCVYIYILLAISTLILSVLLVGCKSLEVLKTISSKFYKFPEEIFDKFISRLPQFLSVACGSD